MKKYTLKSLTSAVTSVMALLALSAQSVKAADIEIYQSSMGSTTTLMLMLDISGSMNVSHSAHDDFNLRSGDGPQAGNDNTRIATPLLDRLETLNPSFRRNRNNRGQITEIYSQVKFNTITNWDGINQAEAQRELRRYLNWSPNSYCQTAGMARYWREVGDSNRQATLITENNADGRGYSRTYCRVPVDATTIDPKYWSNAGRAAVGASWIMDPVIGCPTYDTNNDGRPDERRCYARIDRLKDALWDVINGNPSKGITPLGDNIILGVSTLGLGMDNTGIPWSPNNPLSSGAGRWWHRDLGAIRVPARPLGDMVGGVSQRELLNNYIRTMRPIASTPTARSYTETASYMLGTTTLPNNKQLRETDLVDTGTGGHRSCTAWGTTPIAVPNSTLTVLPCTRWEFADNAKGGNSSWQMIDGYTIAANRFTGPHEWANVRRPNGSPTAYTGAGELLGVDRTRGRVFFGYGSLFPTGFPMSSPDSKDPSNPDKYLAPPSLLNQTKPECNGQGIYVLSDGQPSGRPNELTQMKLALGNKGSTFTCGGGFQDVVGQTDGLQNDWQCIFSFAETLLNPKTNPLGISFKTAAVGFAREYTQGGLPAYDPSLGNDVQADRIRLNLAKIPANDNSDIANFARWGIRGDGGWYAGSSSQSVVDSINGFVATLTTDIPNTATGQPFIPIDPLNPLTRMSDAYYGSFIPKINANNSFWVGDMNKYQVKSQLLYGKDNKKLFNASSGLINPNVIGFWSDNNKNGMTALLPLRANARPVFTNHTSNSNAALTKVTLDALFDGSGALVSDTANRNAWLNLLGYDVPLNGTPVASKTAPELSNSPELRQAGAVMHSTPIVLTQSGTPSNAASREDYVLFGSTQGVLHVVDSKTGVEKVAFVPKEMMANQKQSFQNVDATTSGLLWGIDGPWTAYTQYVPNTGGGVTVKGAEPTSSGDLIGKGVQWVYGGLRMGGRSYYALDLSDIDNPKIKFHIDPASAPAGSPLSFMGQSWSKPTLGFVNWEGSRRLVMFVGGGYDMGYETRTYNQTNGTGGGVYMFDAHNGELLWWGSSHANTSTTAKYTNNVNLKYSVVSNISTFDRNNDGLVDNLTFGDLGGQVFRVDLDNSGSATPTNRVVRLYNGHQAGGLSPRFYESPSLSAHKQDGVAGTFGVISVASGNRSSPLAEGAESAKDALVVLYDHDVLKGTATVTDAPTDNLTDFTGKDMNDASNEVKATAGVQGWKYYLSATAGKLKGYGSPRVVDNFLFLTTYTPDGGTVQQNSCNAGIVGDSYQEIFCMPGGVCTTKQQSLLGGTNANITPNGSQYRTQIGVGIVQAAVGTKDASGASSNENRIVAPKVDCTANPNNPACLTELSSITNKPTRWYEKESRN